MDIDCSNSYKTVINDDLFLHSLCLFIRFRTFSKYYSINKAEDCFSYPKYSFSVLDIVNNFILNQMIRY